MSTGISSLVLPDFLANNGPSNNVEDSIYYAQMSLFDSNLFVPALVPFVGRTANASRAAITGRSRNLPLNVDPLPASGAALFLPRSLRLKTRTAGITEPSVFWASVQIPTYIRPLIRNRGKPLLASLALGILVIHTHQRRGRVHVLAMWASPGGSGREFLSS